jgi:hypothetical protein
MSDIDPKKKDDSKKRDAVAMEASDAKDTNLSVKKSRVSSSKSDASREVPEVAVLPPSNKPVMTLSLESSESRQIYNTVTQNSKGGMNSLQMENSPATYMLVMVTNDVSRMSKINKDKESAYTIINYVPLKMMDSIGFHKAPYEKAEGNAKQMVYFDKKGKLIPGTLSSPLAQAVMINGTKCLDWKTWNPHPCPMMKNKWRGTPTDVVGTICPGVPLSNFLFDEQKDNIMHDSMTEEMLKPFSLALIGIVVRSNEQCGRGYGISIKSIKHVKEINCGMSGIYDKKWFYSDRTDINTQTLDLLGRATRCKLYENDLNFVSKLIRGSADDKVSERPVVYVNLKEDVSKNHSHKIHMHPNNQTLELEFVCDDSIYNGKRFRITIPPTSFTLEETGLSWIQTYYQWCLDSNMADIVIIHDEYQVQKLSEGGAHTYVDCCIVPDEMSIFSKDNMKMAIDKKMQIALSTPVDERFQPINITADTVSTFSGTTVACNKASNVSHSIIIDTSRLRIPKDMQQESTDPAESMSADTEVVDGWKSHTSAVCRLYGGMESCRHVWCGYLLVHDGPKIMLVLPIGIQANRPLGDSGVLKTPADVNIYANPNVFLS